MVVNLDFPYRSTKNYFSPSRCIISCDFCGTGSHSCYVLDDRDSFIRGVEEDHGRTQDTATSDDVGIKDIRHAHKGEDTDLLADPLKADVTGQLLLHNRTQNSCDVVRRHECAECENKKTIGNIPVLLFAKVTKANKCKFSFFDIN